LKIKGLFIKPLSSKCGALKKSYPVLLKGLNSGSRLQMAVMHKWMFAKK